MIASATTFKADFGEDFKDDKIACNINQIVSIPPASLSYTNTCNATVIRSSSKCNSKQRAVELLFILDA